MNYICIVPLFFVRDLNKMLFDKRSRLKKLLRETIRQGYNKDIQKLFDDIVEVSRGEFSEDNLPTLAGFLVENLFKAFQTKEELTSTIVKKAMIAELNNLNQKEVL